MAHCRISTFASRYVRRGSILNCQSNLDDSDMSLPDYISDHFEFDRATSDEIDESQWYGPVNTSVPPQLYDVAPQYKGQLFPGSVDFTGLFIVRSTRPFAKHPVFFVEIKPGGQISKLSGRAAADAREIRASCRGPCYSEAVWSQFDRFAIRRLWVRQGIAGIDATWNYPRFQDPQRHDFLGAGEGEAKF